MAFVLRGLHIQSLIIARSALRATCQTKYANSGVVRSHFRVPGLRVLSHPPPGVRNLARFRNGWRRSDR